MKTYTLESAIESQRNMVLEDIGTAKEEFEKGNYEQSSTDLGAAIAEMGALAAYETIRDNVVKT